MQAASACSASRPSQPNRARLPPQRAHVAQRAGPALCSCPRPCLRHQLPLPTRSRTSATSGNNDVFLPTPNTSPTKPRPTWQVWARGSRESPGPVLLRRAYATTRGPLDAMHAPPPLDRRPPWELWSSAIKAPTPGALELSHCPAAT